jgi:alpha-1,2-mannosyltransferase
VKPQKPDSETGQGTIFTTEIPSFADTASLSRLLEAKGVTINAQPLNPGQVWWKSLLFGFGPTLLFILLLVFLFRRFGRPQSMLSSFGEVSPVLRTGLTSYQRRGGSAASAGGPTRRLGEDSEVDSPAPTAHALRRRILRGSGALGPQTVSRATLRRAADQLLTPLAAYSFLGLLLVAALTPWHPVSAYAWDFRAFYDAGHDYLQLHSPYVPVSLAELTSQRNFVYPLPVAAVFAPLSLIPYPVATVLFIAVSLVLLGLALRLLGIRDWRCYAAMLLGMPVQFGLKLGTLSPLLVFLLAVLWRYRDRTPVAVITLATLVLAKLFLWPLALWFIFMRRSRVAVMAAALSACAVALASVPFHLSVLTDYPSLLRAVSDFEAPFGFSVYAFGAAAGLPAWGAMGLSVAVGGALLAFAFVRGRRGDESAAFRASVVATLALSPIVWGHYLVLLFVPLALIRPRFSALWLATAWVWGDGFVLDEKRLWIVPLVLAVAFLQAGLVDVNALHGRIPTLIRRPPQLVVFAALWTGLVFLLWTIHNVVPTVAALQPVAAAGTSQTGTAFVRFFRYDDKVCWRLWSKGAPAGSHVAITATADGARLVDAGLDSGGQSYGCVRPAARTAYPLLLRTVLKHPGRYRVDVLGPSGQIVLHGALQRRVGAKYRPGG